MRWLAPVALAAAGLAGALLAMEIVVRVTAAGQPGDLPASPRAAPRPELEGVPELADVYDLARPRQRGVFKGVLYRTNSAGMRGPEVSPRPPQGTFRIAVIGDSVTMGQGVEEDETYCALLQRALQAQGDGRRYEVLNLGIAGMNIVHSLKRLVNVALPYHPQLVVYGYTLNDIEGPAYVRNSPEQREAYQRLLVRYQDSPSALLRLLWPRLVMLRSALRPLPGSYEYALERNYFDRPQAWAQVAQGLDRLAAITRRQGICAHVFIHPVIQHLRLGHGFRRVYDHVADAARARDLYATVAFPHFRGRDSTRLRFQLVDRHPNAEGHRVLAEALLAGLRELPPRCGVGLRPGS